MNYQQIAEEALSLNLEQRADLAHRLLLSLDGPDEAEIAAEWLGIAAQRAAEIDDGRVAPVTAEEVRKKVAVLLG
jgi:hypothetical protein